MHGDVERSRRLVGNDQARIARKGHGDQHALAHAARQLMRILPKQVAGLRQPRGVQHGERALAAFAARSARRAAPRCSSNCAPIVSTGLSAVMRRLRDERDRAPEQRTPSRRWHLQKVLALEQQRAGRDRKARREQLGDGAPDHGLAGAGFADEAENFSGFKSRMTARGSRERPRRRCARRPLDPWPAGRARSNAPFPRAARRACGAARRRAG